MLRLLLLSLALISSASARPKNIVIFLADDLGWKDLGCFGSSFYETPHLDGLAAGGMRFTQAYASCPVCSPTRASLLTGKYPPRTGITDFIGAPQPDRWRRKTILLPAPYTPQLDHRHDTMAELLKAGGYATFFAGKWHLGSEKFWPEHQGFDRNMGGIDQGGPYGGEEYFSPYENPRLPDGPPGEHLPDRLATEACQFLEDHSDKPVLIYLSFYSVHTPLMTRDDLKAKYLEKKRELGLEPEWGKERRNKVRLSQDHPVYAGMVEALDLAVGKVLQKLDSLGLADDTAVFFTSDNGGLSTSEGHPTSNLPLRGGKGWMYEGGIREPTIARVPGVTKPGSVCEQYITSPDFFPTVLDIAEIKAEPAEDEIDGLSFLPLLAGKAMPRGPIYWHYPHYGNQGGAPSGAIRDGDLKLIEWYEDGSLELFDLGADPGEKTDLAKTRPEEAATLHKQLATWRSEVGAIMPEPRDQ